MAMKKRPYELSVWVEQLNGSNNKLEKKGVVIGAHDMSYPGKATNLVLTREIKGTNTLTFQMVDRYFDSEKGEFVRNEFIDMLSSETKVKLFYKDRWFEFFIKKVDEKKIFKSYTKTYTCTDAFIDELSRNGYGIIYNTDLYNNVQEIGDFTEETLEDSIWKYHPENNWGDFTEYKEEKLYKIPVSCFGGSISGHKLHFDLTKEQIENIAEKYGTEVITNPYTGEVRNIELSDDLARGQFWDQYVENSIPNNELDRDYYTNIVNDGYIYVPYSCLSFCYGSNEEPNFDETLKYDRAATETAISIDNKLILAPPSVDPRTIIQFYAIPNGAILEIDEAGVILDKEYTFFMTLDEWNRAVSMDTDWWYIFEDTRLVPAEVLGSADIAAPSISHTFKYLKNGHDQILNTDFESCGNKCVIYDGYLGDLNNIGIIKGKKFSITNRTEINISEEIDQYSTVYNAQADAFTEEYSNDDWDYETESTTAGGEKYRVCSKLATRQIVPQLARNLVQNGSDMDSINGWSPMKYVEADSIFLSPSLELRGVVKSSDDETISTSAIVYHPSACRIAQKWKVEIPVGSSTDILDNLTFYYNNKTFKWGYGNEYQTTIGWCDLKALIQDKLFREHDKYLFLYAIGTGLYLKVNELGETDRFEYLCDKNDFIYRGLIKTYEINNSQSPIFMITPQDDYYWGIPNSQGYVEYIIENSVWQLTYDSKNNALFNQVEHSAETKGGSIDRQGGLDIANFGIIGQQKTIEKNKIYCLGVSALATTDFTIKIGRGALISTGTYILSENERILEFNVGKNNPTIDYPILQTLPKSVDDPQQNIDLSEIQNMPEDFPMERFILFKSEIDIENPYFVVSSKSEIVLLKLHLFEAYTKGMDCFPANKSTYRYSGRDLFWPPRGATTHISEGNTNYTFTQTYSNEDMRKMIIFEDEIMLGTTYGYQQYYIQRLRLKEKDEHFEDVCYDTMGAKSFISSDPDKIGVKHLPLDAADCTEDDYVIETNYIDLSKCQFYNAEAAIGECDCTHGNGHTCFYQKFGYCPFRFETEKHNRRIRTLEVEKSNRFNIIQETSKVFEVYPQFYIEHKDNGSVVQDGGEYVKKVFYITDKGRENKLGFRYEKNLNDISRSITSENIVTKLYVLDVDSEISKTGLCSIKTAEDNPSKDSFIIDLSYYIEKGMLDKDEVEQDLYGVRPNETKKLVGDEIPAGFLYQLGYYNNEYDKLTNKIINLQDASFTELEANMTVNYEGIKTAQEQLIKIKKQIDSYKSKYTDPSQYETQQVYLNYLVKYSEQQTILTKLIYDTFYTNNECDLNQKTWDGDCFKHFDLGGTTWPPAEGTEVSAMDFIDHIIDLDASKKYWVDEHKYTMGILGQYNREYLQIQQWKRERASYLKLINQISAAFYKKYEPYLKEGTWSDDNYLTDNAYYFGALDVAAQGAIPKVSYNISVVDISPVDEKYEDIYDFDLADTTYVEDIGMFGINQKTGLPNKLKTICSATAENLDDPTKNTITVQNFTTQFDDLFQQVTATVQNLTFNENIYKRSSNFTSLQNIAKDSLQGTLDSNELTLLDTSESNIKVDNQGTAGSDINNHANKYKLDGQGLFFSNDGGQHWSVGVGPSGINADYIKVGNLDASKVRIVDGAYTYFSWDKEGIVAYRDPQGVNTGSKNLNDAAIFNKYGLSLVSDGHIRLRAGYSYNGSQNPSAGIETEQDVGSDIGFYLYNDQNQVIFSTTSVSNGESTGNQSAAISLVGEMFVTNQSSVVSVQGFNYSTEVSYTGTGCYVFSESDYAYEVSAIVTSGACVIRSDSSLTIDQMIASAVFNNTLTPQLHFISFTESPLEYGFEGLSQIPNSEIIVRIGDNAFTKAARFKCLLSDPEDRSTIVKEVNFYGFTENVGQSKYVMTGNPTTFGEILVRHTDTSKTYTSPNIIYPVQRTGVFSGTYDKIDQTLHCKYGELVTDQIYPADSGNIYYANYDGDTTTMGNGTVGLYLNNKTDLDGYASKTDNKVSRLFVCCSGDENGTVRNIFSVLKDGTLYIGGTIVGETSPQNLSDKIQIERSGIFIDNQGALKMNFGNIQDPQGNTLPSYIIDQISGESQKLQNLIDQKTSGLADANHSHGIQRVSGANGHDFDGDSGSPSETPKVMFGYTNNGSTSYHYVDIDRLIDYIASKIRAN